jgi:pilus assembly protein Flp/PilA
MRARVAAATKVARREQAVTSLEYALIAALIAIVIVGTVRGLGTRVEHVFKQVSAAL